MEALQSSAVRKPYYDKPFMKLRTQLQRFGYGLYQTHGGEDTFYLRDHRNKKVISSFSHLCSGTGLL